MSHRLIAFLAAMLCAAALLTGCSRKPKLHVYIWCDYLSPELIKEFEVNNNCKVVLDIFDSNEMMFSKLQAGGTGYDLVCPSHYFVKKMASQNLIAPIDKRRISTYDQINPAILSKLGSDITDYAVPYLMSYTGLGFNRKAVPELEKNPTWEVFGRTDLKGRMTLLDDYSEVIGAAMLACGLKQADLDDPVTGDANLRKVLEKVLTWRENIVKFENEQYKNGLSSGEFTVVMGYGSDLNQVVENDPENLAFDMPKEGCLLSCDMLVIPVNAPNPDLAYKFIEFLHKPVNAKTTILDIRAFCPNKGAEALLEPEVLNDDSIFVRQEIINNSEFVVELSPENEERHLEIWNKIKAGER